MMLRHGHVSAETNDIHSTHLSFHAERRYDRGWSHDWADSAEPRSRNARRSGLERLRRTRAEAEAQAAEQRRDDNRDLRQWQQPMESAGYVAHREQFV